VPSERHDAQGLLAALRATGASGRRFLFVRGEQARRVLPEGLRAEGADVDEAVVYRTIPAEVDEPSLRAALVRGELDALTFASASAARRFTDCLDAAALSAARCLVVAAIGRTTAKALVEAGLPPEVLPAEADARALAAALSARFARGSQGGTG
jgi:uroporphyrinogen-III synthase